MIRTTKENTETVAVIAQEAIIQEEQCLWLLGGAEGYLGRGRKCHFVSLMVVNKEPLIVNAWVISFVLYAHFGMGSWLTFKNMIVDQRNQMGPMTTQSTNKVLILSMYLGLIIGTTVPVCHLNKGARAEVMGYPVEEVERALTVWFLFSLWGFPVPQRPESFTGTS